MGVTLRPPEKQYISTIEVETHPNDTGNAEKANAEVLT